MNLEKRKKDLQYIALLALLIIFYALPYFVNGQSLYFADLAREYYPNRILAQTALTQGQFPWWNPYQFSGASFVGDPQSALFYPFNILHAVLPFDPLRTFNVLIFFHLFLGGIFMYLLLRGLNLEEAPAFLGALLFSFCSMVYFLHTYSYLCALAWLPLLFFLARRWVQSQKFYYVLWLSFIWSISFLTGAVPLHYFFTVALLFYVFYLFFTHIPKSSLLKSSLHWAFFIMLSLGMVALQLLPSLEINQESVRSAGITYRHSIEQSLSWWGIISLIFPDLWGKDVELWSRDLTSGIPVYLGQALYIGIIPLFMALGTLGKKRLPQNLFFLFLALLSLGGALGQYFILHPLLREGLPFYASLRRPYLWLSLWGFALAVLAACGLQIFSREENPKETVKKPWFYLLILGILFLAAPLLLKIRTNGFNIDYLKVFLAKFSWGTLPQSFKAIYRGGFFFLSAIAIIAYRKKIPKNILLPLLLIFILLDIFSFSWGLIPPKPSSMSREAYSLQQSLEPSPPAKNSFPLRVAVFNSEFLPLRQGMWGGWSNYTGMNVILDRHYWEYLSYWARQKKRDPAEPLQEETNLLPLAVPLSFSMPLTRLGGVEYILSGSALLYSPHYRYLKTLTLEGEEGTFSLHLFKLTNSLPRAWVVPAAEYLPRNKVLERLASPDFDPRKSAVFEEEEHPQKFLLPALKFVQAAPGEVTLQKYSFNYISMLVYLREPGILVLTESYAPGWRAWVNGKPQEVWRANHIFRAVALEAGTHQVELKYRPRGLVVGLAVSAISWTIWLAALLLSYFNFGALLNRKEKK